MCPVSLSDLSKTVTSFHFYAHLVLCVLVFFDRGDAPPPQPIAPLPNLMLKWDYKRSTQLKTQLVHLYRGTNRSEVCVMDRGCCFHLSLIKTAHAAVIVLRMKHFLKNCCGKALSREAMRLSHIAHGRCGRLTPCPCSREQSSQKTQRSMRQRGAIEKGAL